MNIRTTMEDQKHQRKRLQNAAAAIQYRLKKNEERVVCQLELMNEEPRNADLKKRLEKLEEEKKICLKY